MFVQAENTNVRLLAIKVGGVVGSGQGLVKCH